MSVTDKYSYLRFDRFPTRYKDNMIQFIVNAIAKNLKITEDNNTLKNASTTAKVNPFKDITTVTTPEIVVLHFIYNCSQYFLIRFFRLQV